MNEVAQEIKAILDLYASERYLYNMFIQENNLEGEFCKWCAQLKVRTDKARQNANKESNNEKN
jgi:hypothetical protein